LIHDVTLLCVSHSKISSDDLLKVTPLCEEVYVGRTNKISSWTRATRALVGNSSITEQFFSCRDLQKKLQRLSDTKNFDIAFVYCSSMLQYLPSLSQFDAKLIVDLVDVDSEKFLSYANQSSGLLRMAYRKESARVAALESKSVRISDTITLSTHEEAALLRTRLPQYTDKIKTIENGVDAEYFHPCTESPIHQVSSRGQQKASTIPTLLFVGVLDYKPNVDALCWFTDNVWPMIRSRFSEAKYLIAGKNVCRSIRKLNSIQGIEVRGPAPDIRPFFREANILAIPLRTAMGIQNKVLEGMAMGIPIIASQKAVRGTNARAEHELLRAETPDDWVKQIARLMESPALCKTISQKARQYVIQHHDWKKTLEPLRALTENLPAPHLTS